MSQKILLLTRGEDLLCNVELFGIWLMSEIWMTLKCRRGMQQTLFLILRIVPYQRILKRSERMTNIVRGGMKDLVVIMKMIERDGDVIAG
jgi:hypothetical protein